MLDSAGKRVAVQGQLQFLAERRERLDIPDGCRQRIPRLRSSHRKRAVTEGGSTCQRQDQCQYCRACEGSEFIGNTMGVGTCPADPAAAGPGI